MNGTTITTITKDTSMITSIEVLRVDPIHQQELVESMHRATEILTRQPGFVSVNLHRSLDGTHVVNYVQWKGEELLTAAQQLPALREYRIEYQKLASTHESDIYDVVYTDDRSDQGVTTISQQNQFATFINVMSTTPDRQPALVQFVIGNDAQVFASAPGYQSANFHRGSDGTHVINYSHWDSEQAFLDAINVMFKLPSLTMEQANQMATAQAGGVGQTDFRFYTVVFSVHA
ncbi:MAG: antibiotic biosynthesis monooxygenase [Ktedonobacteraceae bacterium]|nr:antibiotic biosynthesis monooxygenase [Ktedonobacteraceae bacterium]